MRQIIRITENDLHNIVRNTVKRIIREGYGYVSNDGNPMVGGSWWSQEEEGTRYLAPSDLAYVLNENGFISEEERDELVDYLEQTVNDDDFVVRASCESGWDESTNYGGCEIGVDDDDIDRIIQIVMNLDHPLLTDEGKQCLVKYVEDYFDYTKLDYDDFIWDEYDDGYDEDLAPDNLD